MSRIWMVYQDAVTPDLPGGTRHYDFASEWSRRENQVTIFAATVHLTTHDAGTGDKGKPQGSQWFDGVEFAWIPTIRYKGNNWRRVLNMVFFALNVIRIGWGRRAEKPDVVIGSSPNLFAAFGAYWLSWLVGCDYVLEVRDLWPQSLIDLGVSHKHPIVLLFGWMERFLYGGAKKIIVLAEGSIDYIVARGIDRGKILYVPNGVHLKHFTSEESRALGRDKYGCQGLCFGYVGVMGESHGLDFVVDALKKVHDEEVHLFLVGNGPARAGLRKRVDEEGLNRIHFVDAIPKKDIPLLLKSMDVGILSLRKADCFQYGISPNKLFDYMGASLPVLAIVDGWVAELVNSNACGISCHSEDVNSIAEGIRKMSRLTENERESMGANGRKVIEEKYNRQKWAEVYLEAIV